MTQVFALGADLIQGLRDLFTAQENAPRIVADYAAARHLAHLVLGSESPAGAGEGSLTALLLEIQELRNENEAYQNRIASLLQDLHREQSTITVLTAAARRTEGSPITHNQSIPDPPLFDGTRSKLRPFLAQLRLKVAGDLHRFPDPQHQLRYATGRLEGLALEQILPLIKENNVIDLVDLSALCHVLENAFGDPDRRATAERHLERLSQANRDFSLYYADFQRLVAEVDWNDGAKRHALSRGLSTELKDALVTIDIPESFEEFSALLQRLDNRIRARHAERTGVQNPRGNGGTQFIRGPTPQGHVNSSHSSTPQGPVPMELSSLRRKLTPAERARRIEEGRCLYCGAHGHLARECPVKPANAARYVLSAAKDGTPSENE